MIRTNITCKSIALLLAAFSACLTSAVAWAEPEDPLDRFLQVQQFLQANTQPVSEPTTQPVAIATYRATSNDIDALNELLPNQASPEDETQSAVQTPAKPVQTPSKVAVGATASKPAATPQTQPTEIADSSIAAPDLEALITSLPEQAVEENAPSDAPVQARPAQTPSKVAVGATASKPAVTPVTPTVAVQPAVEQTAVKPAATPTPVATPTKPREVVNVAYRAGNDDTQAINELLQSKPAHNVQASGADPLGNLIDNGDILTADNKRQRVADAALNYLNTPYKYGGNNATTGFDCSGLVRALYLQAANQSLPRNTAQQASATTKINRSQLQPGDLVFFNTMRRTYSHVGIYVGNNKFIHAPRTGAQVRIEDMGGRYWTTRFTGARRVAIE